MSGCLEICKIRQGITFFAAPCTLQIQLNQVYMGSTILNNDCIIHAMYRTGYIQQDYRLHCYGLIFYTQAFLGLSLKGLTEKLVKTYTRLGFDFQS